MNLSTWKNDSALHTLKSRATTKRKKSKNEQKFQKDTNQTFPLIPNTSYIPEQWIKWETSIRKNFGNFLPYKEMDPENDSVFSLFLMAITDAIGDSSLEFTSELQALLGSCSYVIGQSTEVFDRSNIEDYEYPETIQIKNIPKKKNGIPIHFVFVFHRFYDQNDEKSTLYGLGFFCMVDDAVQYYFDMERKYIDLPVSALRSMMEWTQFFQYFKKLRYYFSHKKWDVPTYCVNVYFSWFNILSMVPKLHTDFSYVLNPEEYGQFCGEYMYLNGNVQVGQNSEEHEEESMFISGSITREELLLRLQKRLQFNTFKFKGFFEEYQAKRFAIAFGAKNVRDRSIDFLLKYIFCILFFYSQDLLFDMEKRFFDMRMMIQLSTPLCRFKVLESNYLLEEFRGHLNHCEHTMTDCFYEFLWEKYKETLCIMLYTVKKLHFDEATASTDKKEKEKEKMPNNCSLGTIGLEDIIVDASKIVEYELADSYF